MPRNTTRHVTSLHIGRMKRTVVVELVSIPLLSWIYPCTISKIQRQPKTVADCPVASMLFFNDRLSLKNIIYVTLFCVKISIML